MRHQVPTLGKAECSKVQATSSAGSLQFYNAASTLGRLAGGPTHPNARVFSLRDRGGHKPLYLLSTDLSLAVGQTVQLYAGRWLIFTTALA